MNKQHKASVLNYLLLLLISCIWGSQFIFNKIALQNFSSIEIAFLRAFIGMMTLTILLKFIPKQSSNSSLKNYSLLQLHFKLFVIGLFEATIPFLLVAWGQQYIESSVAAI